MNKLPKGVETIKPNDSVLFQCLNVINAFLISSFDTSRGDIGEGENDSYNVCHHL